MNGDPYSRFVQKMRQEGAHDNGFQIQMEKVISVEPLTISYNNVPISESVITSQISVSDIELEQILSTETGISVELKQVLNDFYNMIKLAPGDNIMVQRVDNFFYILGKI